VFGVPGSIIGHGKSALLTPAEIMARERVRDILGGIATARKPTCLR
jgi:hypothetical protein